MKIITEYREWKPGQKVVIELGRFAGSSGRFDPVIRQINELAKQQAVGTVKRDGLNGVDIDFDGKLIRLRGDLLKAALS